MSKMTKNKKKILITILCIALIQMPFLALTPAIERMSQFFSDRTLSEIQTAIALPSLISMFSSLVSAFFIAKGWISKKTAVIAGLCFAISTGFAAIFLHTEFWHLILYSVILGISLGFFIPTSASIMFDAFDEKERQMVTGLQTSFINIGGIIMSAVGGLLATLMWYGGYLTFLLMIPVAVLAVVALPGSKDRDSSGLEKDRAKRSKLPAEVFYYGILIFLFMLIFNVGG
ncbi:MAG: MFS transporter, partial [Clostridiales bacterium]|nr:MFS transporter [Clostridiales bacterium]